MSVLKKKKIGNFETFACENIHQSCNTFFVSFNAWPYVKLRSPILIGPRQIIWFLASSVAQVSPNRLWMMAFADDGYSWATLNRHPASDQYSVCNHRPSKSYLTGNTKLNKQQPADLLFAVYRVLTDYIFSPVSIGERVFLSGKQRMK